MSSAKRRYRRRRRHFLAFFLSLDRQYTARGYRRVFRGRNYRSWIRPYGPLQQ